MGRVCCRFRSSTEQEGTLLAVVVVHQAGAGPRPLRLLEQEVAPQPALQSIVRVRAGLELHLGVLEMQSEEEGKEGGAQGRASAS